MSRYSISFILIVFFYFFINAVVLFFQGEQSAGLCCLTIAIGLPYLILKKEDYVIVGGVLVLFSVFGAFSNYADNIDDPKHQYYEYVLKTFEGGYFGEHESKVNIACGIQSYVNTIHLVFHLFKALYYNVFLSAIDFIVVQTSDPVQNKCLIAVEELRAEYPEFNPIPNKKINKD
jgi:hypothetical protein